MAGGAITFLYNTIYASYSHLSSHFDWPSNAELFIIYYNTNFPLYQPVILTHSHYNDIITNRTNVYDVSGFYYDNASMATVNLLEVYGAVYGTQSMRRKMILQNNTYAIAVG